MKKIFFIGYGLILFLITIFSYAFVDPSLIYYKDIYSGFAFQNRMLTTLLYVVFVISLFSLYLLILSLINKNRINKKDVWILISITCGILFFSYPAMLSYDIFNYMTTARLLFFYHENPYIIMPTEFIGDPYLLFTHAANKLALYGPIWILFSGIPHFIGLGNFLLTLMSFKLVALIFYLFTAVTLFRLSKSLYVLSLFAFNPLIIIELLISSHNDVVMIFLVLFSFLLLQRKRYLWALFIFILSILIKYATIFLLPLFIFIFWNIYKGKTINWKIIYYFSFLSMLAIFVLSPIREEMYPWYIIWVLPFVFLIPERKTVLYLSIAFSLGLLLRYVPFMYTGNHFGITPMLRIVLMLVPVFMVGIYVLVRNLVPSPFRRRTG